MRHVAHTGLAIVLAALSACSLPKKSPDDASPTADVIVVAQLTATRPGNIAVTPQGRVIVTNQPLDEPELRAIEILPDGTTKPFPTLDWADGPDKGDVGIAGAIGIASSQDGVIWLLDMGTYERAARLIAWDTVEDKLERIIEIARSAVRSDSFLQDFALDEKRKKIYIADMTFPGAGYPPRPAFIVVDLETGDCRRVLERSRRLMPVARDVVIDGSLVGTTLKSGASIPWHLSLNPIAIDPAFEWVYFGTINGDDVFRLPAAALADSSVSENKLAARIEFYAKKRPSDGIAVDARGRVYVTDIEASAIGIATPDGYRILAQDKTRLAWPDGFALTNDGWLYATQNQLHAHPDLNEDIDETRKPFHIVKVRVPE